MKNLEDSGLMLKGNANTVIPDGKDSLRGAMPDR